MKLAQSIVRMGLSLAAAHAAAAQSSVIMVDSNDVVASLGTPEVFGQFVINDAGEWLLLADTDFADEEADAVMLRNGFLTLAEGTIVAAPPGASIDEFKSLTIDDFGNGAWDLLLVDPNSAINSIEGVYLNTRAIALDGDLLNTPGYGETATWFRFNGFVRYNNSDQVLVASEVDDVDISGFSDQSLILLDLDGQGNIISRIDIAHESGGVPGLPYAIPRDGLTVGNRSLYDLNDDGEVLWQTRLEGAPTANDRAILLNDQLLLQEGDPSPIPGLNWSALGNVRLDLNNNGDYVHEGTLDAAAQNVRELIAKNGVAVIRERDALPIFAPALVNDFGAETPILLSDAGDVFFRVTLTGFTGTNAAFMIGEEVLIQKGVTRIESKLVQEFVDSVDSLAISPGGRYVMFKVMLEDLSTAICLLDLGRVTPLADCGGNPGKLSRQSGFAVVGGTVTLAVDEGQGMGVTPVLLFSDRTIAGFPPCGLSTTFGEIIVDFGGPNPFLGLLGNPFLGAPVPFRVDIVNDLQLVDLTVYAQGFFLDIGAVLPNGPQFTATNVVEIEIGAP